ncbi:hypothetical protein M431DRAFT_452733 [Trichoderma harzianum CBS 226.95]|uniref:Uncharacterized protein n=1 Tax=Trichoderma harzianum CBS 226.95 TaxID=983964 RepID=A0A2T4AAW8_TRIHA|nr:hypothetical protein M431DRAFT_452733 [Trichoderma harzianum CBS 226.95]PTB54221.1 hypothetical protein M431DRAFT_452733 [Trichoderma harzianum CBS 226.95]
MHTCNSIGVDFVKTAFVGLAAAAYFSSSVFIYSYVFYFSYFSFFIFLPSPLPPVLFLFSSFVFPPSLPNPRHCQ